MRVNYTIILFPLVIFLMVFMLWASLMEIDQVVRGVGKVVPSGQVQTVQHLEGGIISEILVREGQRVSEGQVMYRIRNESAQANLGSLNLQLHGDLATQARLEAQLSGADEVVFAQELMERVPTIVENERKIFIQKHKNMEETIQVLKDQADQNRSQLAEARNNLQNYVKENQIATEQVKIAEDLVKSGAGSRRDYLEARMRQQSLLSRISETQGSIPTLEKTIAGAESRIAEARTKFMLDDQTQLASILIEIGRLREEITSSQDRLQRTDVVAPVTGTVKVMNFYTIGGVVRPADTVAEIIPAAGRLILEGRVRPADRGRLWVGQKANVRISAYDFGMYGSLEATVTEISADTLMGEQREEYYRIMLESERTDFGPDKPLIPGMTGEINIMTGKNTVMSYILKPIKKAFTSAFTEP